MKITACRRTLEHRRVVGRSLGTDPATPQGHTIVTRRGVQDFFEPRAATTVWFDKA